MKKWIVMIVRPICMCTTAMMWIVINFAVLHYLLVECTLTGYTRTLLLVGLSISALSGAGYLIYRWLKAVMEGGRNEKSQSSSSQ